jgi:hypothetical protein
MPMLKRRGVLGARWVALIAVVTGAASSVVSTNADAVSLRVKLACSRDYYALCSQYASDSPETRQCMRAAGHKLSPRCINALVEEGEVSGTEVARRSAQLRQ